GVSMTPQVVGGTQRQSAIVVTVADDAAPSVGALVLEAQATVDGKPETRPVQAATITYPNVQNQQNAPPYSPMDRELLLAIRGRPAYAIVRAKDKISVSLGDKISIAATMKPLASDFKGDVTVSVVGPPVLSLAPVKLAADKETTLTLDFKNNQVDKI